MEMNISQFREGSLKRKLGIPSIRKAGFCLGEALGGWYVGFTGDLSEGIGGIAAATFYGTERKVTACHLHIVLIGSGKSYGLVGASVPLLT